MRACGRRAFTLVEILVATAVLALMSVGFLSTVWHLVGFAQDQADFMAADAYCHDLLWATYSQDYADIAARETFRLNVDKELPRVEMRDLFGREKVVRPLMRHSGDMVPECEVLVSENEGRTEKTITIVLHWQTRGEAQSHRVTVTREKTGRKAS